MCSLPCRSDSIRRFAAFIEDYREIVEYLNGLDYGERYLYGFSFGGVVLMNAINNFDSYSRVVLDATPSQLEDFGFKCERKYNPVDHVPQSCSNFIALRGTQDRLVDMEKTKLLFAALEGCRAQVFTRALGHPFQGDTPEVSKRRVVELGRLLKPRVKEIL